MSAAEGMKVTLERSQAGRRGSAAWKLGMPVRPYVWRRDDPERDAKIAAERAESAQKSAAAKARFAKPRGRDWSDCRTCEGPLAGLKETVS